MIGIIILAVILVLLVISFVAYYYNKIIRLENRIDNSWAQIDVQLKRRADLIPNLVESVKGYMEHEKGVLENVTKARSALMNAGTPRDNIKANNQLTSHIRKTKSPMHASITTTAFLHSTMP